MPRLPALLDALQRLPQPLRAHRRPRPDGHDGQGAATLTRDEQDRVVDECFQCKLCYVKCPYIPGQSEWAIDFPRLMLRARATRHAEHEVGRRYHLTTSAMARTDLVGALGSRMASVANAATAKPGSLVRKVMEKATGVSSVRLLPPFAAAALLHLVPQAPPGARRPGARVGPRSSPAVWSSTRTRASART